MKEKKADTRYMNGQYYECSYSLILDKRHPKANRKTFPLAMRFTMDRKSFYYNVEGEYSEEEFTKICSLKNKAVRSELYKTKEKFDAVFAKYRNMVERLGANITLDAIRIACTRVDKRDDNSFVGIWEERIHHLMTDDNGARWTTGESYRCALNSFKKILGDGAVKGFRINQDIIQKWSDGMKNGVKQGDLVVGKIADATRGIYLRVCRSVWNECVERGYLIDVPYPFSNKKEKGLVAIPTGATRKDEYLDVGKMTDLYNVFIEKRYPESWSAAYTQRAHYSLGLFLVQYLGNGFNLADAGLLKYDNYYFTHESKAFRFARKKTRQRSDSSSEVIIPIIEPLQKILSEIAAKPELNAYVFPDIQKGATDEITIRKYVKQENSNVQDRLVRVCTEVLGWEQKPSGTWARHSFATNLTHAGVDRHYITESMGHSDNTTVTDRYIAQYPLSKQFEYNQKLLKTNEPVKHSIDIDSLTEKEKTELLKKLLGQK